MTEIGADGVPELTYSVLVGSEWDQFYAQQTAIELAHAFGTSGTVVHDPFGMVAQAHSNGTQQTLVPSPAAVQPGED